jgi:HD-like signal output (HDOD) protein
MEPLIGAKLLHLANSVAFNPAGLEVVDLKSAITRLGVNAVSTTAMSIVMTSTDARQGNGQFADINSCSLGSLDQDCRSCPVIAKNLTRLNPEEAMLAGLIHDLGRSTCFTGPRNMKSCVTARTRQDI